MKHCIVIRFGSDKTPHPVYLTDDFSDARIKLSTIAARLGYSLGMVKFVRRGLKVQATYVFTEPYGIKRIHTERQIYFNIVPNILVTAFGFAGYTVKNAETEKTIKEMLELLHKDFVVDDWSDILKEEAA